MPEELVLVTGGSGFIGTECIIQLLRKNYRVRTTVRSQKRQADLETALNNAKVEDRTNLSCVEADLLKDDGWAAAVKDCTYVLHVASPFPPKAPKNENDLIEPARDGTLRVLRASRDAGVKRVVVTSSTAAITYFPGDTEKLITEEDWSDVSPGSKITPYPKSKTLAERAVWDFVEKDGGALEVSVINPCGVYGPLYSNDTSTSIELVKYMLEGRVPGCVNLKFGLVDVRDVADLHIRAMTDPKAKGERFIAQSDVDGCTVQEIAFLLKEKLGTEAKKVPTRMLPDFLLKLAAWFDPTVALVVPELSRTKRVSSEKAQRVLEWTPIPKEDSVIATARSLIDLGIVKV